VTKDEKFLLALYEALRESGAGAADRFQVGESIGLQNRAVKAICRLLVQANFIKREEGEMVSLTDHGKALAQTYLD